MKISALKELINAREVGPPSHNANALFVYGATADDRQVRGGSVFFALESKVRRKNPQTGVLEPQPDRRPERIRNAVKAGAQAVVFGARLSARDLGMDDYQLSKVVLLQTENPEAQFARTAKFFNPEQPEQLIAVTGTNGKSSTVSIVRDIWLSQNFAAYSLGTLGLVGAQPCNELTKNLTTPEADGFSIFLRELALRHGATHLALEASSQGLGAEERQAGVEFAAAGFTNFTQDHLDYHEFDYQTGTVFDHEAALERYFECKMRLFTQRLRAKGTAVINIDDAKGPEIVRRLETERPDVRIMTYSRRDPSATLFSVDDEASKQNQMMKLAYEGQEFESAFPISGEFQRENALCALGLAMATHVCFQDAVAALAGVSQIVGRMEVVRVPQNPRQVYVDYAHTDDALKSVLQSLNSAHPNAPISVVFGCGGDRDPGKRKPMAQWAMQLADKIYVTDDNPRGEEPVAIRLEILAACAATTAPRGIAQDGGARDHAIQMAIAELPTNGVLVIAGKGHEDYQEIDSQGARAPFSDQSVALTALEKQLK